MEVKCVFFRSSGGLGYYCSRVTSTSIIERNIEIKSFVGQHVAGHNNNSVGKIQFMNTEVEFIPRGLLSNFPHLMHLAIFNCGLKEIRRDDLAEFNNLEKLIVSYNQLETLPSDLFIGKTALKIISFSNNKLEFVSSQLLKPIIDNHLEIVDLTKNTKIDAKFSLIDYSKGLGGSLDDLMELIDTQCEEPQGEVSGFTDETCKDKWHEDIKKIWSSGDFSDFVIIVNGLKKFYVHKWILSIKSSVFAAMFKNDMEEGTTCKLDILDFTADAVYQFLEFLYTGSVPDDINVMELFALASKYNISNLKTLSEEAILKNLRKKNALEVFYLGHLYSSDEMKRAAFQTIKRMFPGEPLSENLASKPEALKEYVDAAKSFEKLRKNINKSA